MAPPAYKCSACRALRRKCSPGCIYAPHFPANDPYRFDYIHRIYGSSTVGKMLQQTPPYLRGQLVNSLHFEAQCRIEDPVYGSAGVVSNLQQEIKDKEIAIAILQAEIAQYKLKLSQYEAALNSEVMSAQNQSTEQYQWPNQDLMVQSLNMEQLQLPNHPPQMPQLPEQDTEPFQWSNQVLHMLTQNISMEQSQWLSQDPTMPQLPVEQQWPNPSLIDQGQNIEQTQWIDQAPQVPPMPEQGLIMGQLQLPHQTSAIPTQGTSIDPFHLSSSAPWFN